MSNIIGRKLEIQELERYSTATSHLGGFFPEIGSPREAVLTC